MSLAHLLKEQAQKRPAAPALAGPHAMTYGALDQRADQLAHALRELGVGTGDRVAVWLPKGPDSVAAMQAALRLGAVYVPIDLNAPRLRATQIIADCDVSVLVTGEHGLELKGDLGLIVPGTRMAGDRGRLIDAEALEALPATAVDTAVDTDDLAYLLYTSGSTGKPKGVCISHGNALAFVTWAAEYMALEPEDRLANHAGFGFDLSVFDLYGAFCAGAAVVLVSESAAWNPAALVSTLHEDRITVWYSVPSALQLMMSRGGLLERAAPRDLRAVIFAGEPFPMPELRRLRGHLPHVRLCNFYGPTETNVCTYFEVTGDADVAGASLPIGHAASGDRIDVLTEGGVEAAVDEPGELVVTGPTVMHGYWGAEPLSERVYHTGDIGYRDAGGVLHFVGRRDSMVKLRGHRVELGEVEAAVCSHPGVREAAVIVVGDGLGAQLVACLSGTSEPPPSLLSLKEHCARTLPRYMLVDRTAYFAELPRTHNGKIDRRQLAQLVATRQRQ